MKIQDFKFRSKSTYPSSYVDNGSFHGILSKSSGVKDVEKFHFYQMYLII